MDNLTLFGTAVALGADAFAVSAAVAAGLPVLTSRHVFRLAWHFGLFQALMTAVGWMGGGGLSAFMGGMGHWIAFGVLLVLGGKMIWDSTHEESRAKDYDPTRGWSLVALSIATSIDALAVGVSLSLIGMPVVIPSIVIGVAALVMAFIGTRLGKRGGALLGQWADRIGGVILVLIGVRILAGHLMT